MKQTDIVARLRTQIECFGEYSNADDGDWVAEISLCTDAAIEVERLREELRIMRQPIGCTYSTKLKCAFSAWRVLADGELALDLPDGNCCDMIGAIEIAEKIMPAVWRIATFAGGQPDTEYRHWQGKWLAAPSVVITGESAVSASPVPTPC